MRVLRYIYDSRTADPAVERVLDRLADRDEAVERTDIGTAADPDDARRDALLAVGDATRIGRKPSGLFDGDGRPDFSAGALIVEAPTGRRDLHVGEAAVEALREAETEAEAETETGPEAEGGNGNGNGAGGGASGRVDPGGSGGTVGDEGGSEDERAGGSASDG